MSASARLNVGSQTSSAKRERRPSRVRFFHACALGSGRCHPPRPQCGGVAIVRRRRGGPETAAPRQSSAVALLTPHARVVSHPREPHVFRSWSKSHHGGLASPGSRSSRQAARQGSQFAERTGGEIAHGLRRAVSCQDAVMRVSTGEGGYIVGFGRRSPAGWCSCRNSSTSAPDPKSTLTMVLLPSSAVGAQ